MPIAKLRACDLVKLRVVTYVMANRAAAGTGAAAEGLRGLS